MTTLSPIRKYRKSQFFIHISCKDGTFQCSCSHGRSQEKSLIEGLHNSKSCSYLFSKTRGSQAVCTVLHISLFSYDIASYGCQSAAWVLDQGSHTKICSHICRLDPLYKFTITVVHHTDHIRFDGFNKCNHLANLCHRQGLSGLVTFGPLNMHHLGLLIDSCTDTLQIKAAVCFQIHLAIGHAILCKASIAWTDSNNFLQRVIRLSGNS